jgi:integrase/recombinase XerD
MARTAKPWFNGQKNCWMVWFNGRRVRLAEGKKNKKAAQDRYDELRFEAAHNPHPDCGRVTVASIIERYQGFADNRLAASTKAGRWPYLQSFAEAHGWRSLTDARPDHIQEWVDHHPEWESDWTKRSALASVQAAFNWALKCRIIKENPFRGVSHRSGLPRRNMTEREFQAILRVSGGKGRKTKPTPGARFRQILTFLWYTGCRPCEATKLRWIDIDFERALIVLQEHKTIRTQKRPRPRIVPLHPVVLKLLTQLRDRGEGAYVFLTHCKTRWTKDSLARRIARARKKAAVPNDAKLYGIRHAFGTRSIIAGVDLKTTSELMGHTTTQMTEHYVHLAGQTAHLAAAMRLANVRRPGA